MADTETLYAWKFIVPSDRWVPDPDHPEREYKGCVAVAIAPTRNAAMLHLKRYAAENGMDIGWLNVATVKQIPIIDGSVLSWAEV